MSTGRGAEGGAGLPRLHRTFRAAVPALEQDRPRSPDIECIAKMIASGAVEFSCDGEVK